MKKLKIIISILVIVIIIIVVSLIFIKKNQENFQDVTEEQIEHVIEHGEEEQTDKVKDNTKFFTVTSCISQYLDLLNYNNDIYYGYNEQEEYEKIMEPSESLIQVLNPNYIKSENITENNLKDKIQFLEEKLMFVPLEMRVISNGTIDKYLAYGIVENLENEYIQDLYVFVNLDETNSTFSIEPIKEKYDNIYDINYSNNETSIEENDFNIYEEVDVDGEYISKAYLDIYKKIALAKPELAYQFLDKEYREKRFGNLQEYIKYLDETKEQLKTLTLNKYLVNSYDDYIEYVCKDKYETLYIFKESSLMDISLKLDTYTIETEKFKTEYEKGDVQTKVQMNINKFILMINNQDYKSAYEVLDETFRNNYFKTQEEFENYVKNKAYRYNEMTFNSFDAKGKTYLCGVTLTDLTNGAYEDETKGTGGSGYELEWKFIMQLGEGTDFVISFEIE